MHLASSTFQVKLPPSRQASSLLISNSSNLSSEFTQVHTMRVSCQCGSVEFDTLQSKPLALYHCHCTQCQKQSASAFGTSAVFSAEGIFPLSAELQSKLQVWSRPTIAGRRTDGYFCKSCGVRVMHRKRNADGSETSKVCKNVPQNFLPPCSSVCWGIVMQVPGRHKSKGLIKLCAAIAIANLLLVSR